MKRIILAAALALVSFSLSAQAPTVNWPYLFPEFQDAEVSMKGEVVQNMKVNIFVVKDALHYLDAKGIIKEAPVLDLVSIKIGDDEYRNVSGEMMKVMASSPKGFITLEQVGDIEMNIDAKLRYRPEVSNNGESSQAFKTPSQVKSNVVTIADILIPIGKTPKALKDAAGNDPTKIELKSEFYVHTDGFIL